MQDPTMISMLIGWRLPTFTSLPSQSITRSTLLIYNNRPPNAQNNDAYCKDVAFASAYNVTPHVFVSANHSTTGGNLSPVHNGITAWVEYINKTGFRVCFKELYVRRYDPLSITYTVLSEICPSGWGYFNGYCYFTSSVCATWLTAVTNCSAMGSQIVTVHNQEENVYIQHRHNGKKSWIGLNDRSVEGSFVWTNKEISSFRFWAPRQPNNCVHALCARHGYTWNDVPCDNCYNFTCFKASAFKSCAELYKVGGSNVNGVYKIDPDGLGEFEVFCDQKTAGGGWTVFQRRQDGSVDFFRGWYDYKRGFGNLNGEFWLGLDKIHWLTVGGCNKLRVDLEDFNSNTAFAEYSSILVANEMAKYQLTLGSYGGTAGDSMSYHSGSNFTTKDRDNDRAGGNCALQYKGAFWYKHCHNVNLNGKYLPGTWRTDAVVWYH